jgi:tyrosyl-tRNA synthetase
MGRFLQEQYQQEAQVIMTLPLLEGLDGGAKMSKSYNNTIGLAEPAETAYGKLLSISDLLMWHYAELLLLQPPASIREQQQAIAQGTLHPLATKKRIAHAIVARFWGVADATRAQAQFEAVIQHKEHSEAPFFNLPPNLPQPVSLVELVKLIADCSSSSQARRLIEAGAVSINGEKLFDCTALITVTSGMIIKAGKHTIYRIR